MQHKVPIQGIPRCARGHLSLVHIPFGRTCIRDLYGVLEASITSLAALDDLVSHHRACYQNHSIIVVVITPERSSWSGGRRVASSARFVLVSSICEASHCLQSAGAQVAATQIQP